MGAYFTFETEEGEQVEVQMGVSFVSIENARLNLDKEQSGKTLNRCFPMPVHSGTMTCHVSL